MLFTLKLVALRRGFWLFFVSCFSASCFGGFWAVVPVFYGIWAGGVCGYCEAVSGSSVGEWRVGLAPVGGLDLL
jgi:hypothetical protein